MAAAGCTRKLETGRRSTNLRLLWACRCHHRCHPDKTFGCEGGKTTVQAASKMGGAVRRVTYRRKPHRLEKGQTRNT